MAEANSLLNIIVQSAQEYLKDSKASQDVQIENAQQGERIVGNAEAIYQQVASDAALVEFQRGTADLKAQNSIRAIANAGGVNVDTGAGFIQDRVAELRQKSVDAAALLSKRRQELDVNLITNPLGWIKAQVDWNSTGHKLETTVRELELANNSVGAMNKALQESARTTELVKESHTAATIEARARIAGADALLKSQQAALEGLRYNSQQVQIAEKGSKDRLDAMYNAATAVRLEEQFKLALEQFGLQKEKFAWDREEKKHIEDAKKVGKLADDLSLEYINKSMARMGQPPIDAREAATMLQLFKSGASKELQFHWENGRRITMTGVSMIGNKPSEVAEVLAKIPSNLPEIQAQVAALIGEYAKEFDDGLSNEAKKAQLSGDPKTARAKFIDKRVAETVAAQYSKVTGPGNLFYVGNIGAFIGNATGDEIASLQALPISRKLLTPLVQQGVDLSEPKVVMGQVIEAVRKGTLTTSEAQSGLAEIYRRANEIQQASRGLTGFGIVPPNAGKNYFAPMGAFGRTVDMADPNSIGRFIAQESAKFAYKNMVDRRNEARRTDPLTGQSYGR